MSTSETAVAASSALRVQVERVHSARRNVEAMAGTLKTKREAFDRDNADLVDLLRAQKQALDEEELRLRDMAVAEFKATGATKPGPGLQIKVSTELAYDEKDAFAWALDKQIALALNKKGFEEIAKATMLPFVTINHVPKATIATDLDKALAGGET